MSYFQAVIDSATGNLIRVAHPELPALPLTTSASSVAGATSLNISDPQGLANGDYVILGELGQSKSELVQINGAVTRGSALAITATLFDHPQDTPVQFSAWNQVEISGAATVTGSKTVIVTTAIQTALPCTSYINNSTTYAFYFCRFKQSTTGAFSSYSDAAPAAGFDADTVRAVKVTALNLTGEKIDGIITDDFLNTEITNCEIDIWKQKRRWAQFYVDHYVIGTLTAGVVDYALPADISDKDTNSAIRSVRVRQIGMLEYVDIEAIEGLLWDTAVTTLATTTSVGATSITATSVADLSDDGSILLGSDSVTYTARDTTTNVLSGIPASGEGSITVAWPATTTYIWQGGNVEISPTVYTVKPGYVNTILPPASSYTGQALYLSYYKKPTYPDSDADLIEWPDAALYNYFLAWRIDLRRHNGSVTDAGANFKNLYNERRDLLLSRARMQDTSRFIPLRRTGRQNTATAGDGSIVPWVIR